MEWKLSSSEIGQLNSRMVALNSRERCVHSDRNPCASVRVAIKESRNDTNTAQIGAAAIIIST